MDKLAAMAAFVEIAKHRSLTAAADALGKAQPTMVRTLANLESHLGVRLLHRTTRSLALTAEGSDYLERCRRILADVEEAERVMDSSAVAPRGTVRVTAPVTFGHLHVVPVVNDFLRRWPEVNVDLLLMDRTVNLIEEGVDLAVRIGPLLDSSMISQDAGVMRQVVVASSSLLARTGMPREPADLATLPCVHFLGGSSSPHWPFTTRGKVSQVSITPRVSVNQALPAVSACVAGLGFGRFLEYQVREAISRGSLKTVLESFETPPLPISLLTSNRRGLSSRLRLLRSDIRDALLDETKVATVAD